MSGAPINKTSKRAEVEPEIFLSRYRTVSDRHRDSEEAKAAWKAEVNVSKSIGINLKAMKIVEKLRKMEPREAQTTFRDTILYLRWLGLNLLDQEDMFSAAADSTAGLTAHVVATQAAWEAGWQGYDAGKAGMPLDQNPYAPGTETHQRWASEWHDGSADMPASKEIHPREEDEEHGEEGE